jgi:hypothetical protein
MPTSKAGAEADAAESSGGAVEEVGCPPFMP